MSFDDTSDNRRIRVQNSHLPRAVPAGSSCVVEEVPPQDLNFGDVIFLMDEGDLILQRFLEFDGGQLVTTAENARGTCSYPIPGRVARVTQVLTPDGSSHDPSKGSLWEQITRFGTRFRQR